MARYQSRRRAEEEDPDEERRPGRARRASSSPNMALVLIAFVVLAAGSIAVIANMQPVEGETEEVEKADPFAGLPAEEPPPRVGGGGTGSGTDKPRSAFEGLADLRDDPDWKASSKIAQEADQLRLLASEALEKGDRMLFRLKGEAAQEKYAEALTGTDAFEKRIGTEHGFDHPDVRRIISTRSKWRKTLVALKKTTGI